MLAKFGIPAAYEGFVRAGPEGRIPLFEHPPKPPPPVQVVVFHVERYPVEVAPAPIRRAGDQAMHLGIDDL